VAAPQIDKDPNFNPFSNSDSQSNSFGSGFGQKKVSSNDIAALEKMYENLPSDRPAEITVSSREEEVTTEKLIHVNEQKLPYQLHKKYVINHIKSGFIVIDQQRAHERILFEQFVQKIANNRVGTQQMMFPLTVELSQQDIGMLQSVSNDLIGIGFDISEFGNGSIIINGIPDVLSDKDVKTTMEEILASLHEEVSSIKLGEKMARSMAKSAGIKKGMVLSIAEMQRLIDELFACEQPFYSPTGKPTTVTVPLEELEKKFEN
ncbi:MAG: hypothetical protein JKY54_03955, partial [Flavobacteriales bacterium]|nr:hypothetical protein [Flavobacteriales bacterium]